MATTIRKRFELDPSLLEGLQASSLSAEALKEMQRALRLNRQHTKYQSRLEASADVPGFESRQRPPKKDVSSRKELTSDDLVCIITHWKSTKCSLKDLATRYKIKATLAHRIIT